MTLSLRSASVLLLFLTPCAFSMPSQYPCDKTLVHATTLDNEKEVRICLSQGRVTYTQRLRNADKPEIDIRVPASHARFEYTKYFQTLEVEHGKETYHYEFFPEMDIRQRLTGYVEINDIFIYHDTHPKEALHLPKTTQHAIRPSLSQYGLKNITGYRRK